MKSVLLALMIAIAAPSYSGAQELQSKDNRIAVLGGVELKEVADQAAFTFSVKGVGESLRLAVQDANRKVKAIADQLVRLGISSAKIATSQFYSGENYGDKSFWSSKRDYQAILTTLVTVDSLALMDTILYAVSEGEIQNVSNVNYSLKDEVGARRKARIQAALKAKEKAEDISTSLGFSIGKIISVEETEPTRVIQPQEYAGRRYGYIPTEYNSSPFNPSSVVVMGQAEHGGNESVGSGFFAQTISVTSEVKVVFEIKY